MLTFKFLNVRISLAAYNAVETLLGQRMFLSRLGWTLQLYPQTFAVLRRVCVITRIYRLRGRVYGRRVINLKQGMNEFFGGFAQAVSCIPVLVVCRQGTEEDTYERFVGGRSQFKRPRPVAEAKQPNLRQLGDRNIFALVSGRSTTSYYRQMYIRANI